MFDEFRCQLFSFTFAVSFFFFQAEDGIRDLVRSRGLGDVYKRQALGMAWILAACGREEVAASAPAPVQPADEIYVGSVSYTHLTLPTSDLV